uniref:Uncharacterized protein n=1 Tax=Arundo donax TaxID=35708 RepID=A0A0A9GT94_ARUDO
MQRSAASTWWNGGGPLIRRWQWEAGWQHGVTKKVPSGAAQERSSERQQHPWRSPCSTTKTEYSSDAATY